MAQQDPKKVSKKRGSHFIAIVAVELMRRGVFGVGVALISASALEAVWRTLDVSYQTVSDGTLTALVGGFLFGFAMSPLPSWWVKRVLRPA